MTYLDKTVDFVVIGAQKGGTTALHGALAGLPGLNLPRSKEAPFFAVDSLFELGVVKYIEENFDRSRPDALLGTISPQYMYSGLAPERLRRHNSLASVAAVLRDPVERAMSHYRMEVRRGHENRPFEEVVAAELDDKNGTGYLGRGRYGHLCAPWVAHFGERFKLFSSAHLLVEPETAANGLHDWLGIDVEPSTLSEVKNPGTDRTDSRERAKRLLGGALLKPLRRRIPSHLRSAAFTWLDTGRRGTAASSSLHDLAPSLVESLVTYYQDDRALISGYWRDFGVGPMPKWMIP